ncbi:hypothetical protein ACFUIY_13300 [Streptomyces griseorubiginosus]|uniref:hypothetical protein n=1 Tax=Streptomyces griseorubiginosus TaxID=67304 RepID=UPI00362B3679
MTAKIAKTWVKAGRFVDRYVGAVQIVGLHVTTLALTEALARDAASLLAAYDVGTWMPTEGERNLADGLARAHWGPGTPRAFLREVSLEVRSGRLVEVLDPVATVLETAEAPGRDGAVVALRQLVDALAADG